MDSSDQVTLQLPYLQESKLLTLHWRSMSGWGREPDVVMFDSEGSQYLVYESLQAIAT